MKIANIKFYNYKNSGVNQYYINRKNTRQVSYTGKVSLKNFSKWIEQNNINAKSMYAYNTLLTEQQNNSKLMEKIKFTTPRVVSTRQTIDELITDSQGKPFHSVEQLIGLYKKEKCIGIYDVQYDLKGNIIDDYLKIYP